MDGDETKRNRGCDTDASPGRLSSGLPGLLASTCMVGDLLPIRSLTFQVESASACLLSISSVVEGRRREEAERIWGEEEFK